MRDNGKARRSSRHGTAVLKDERAAARADTDNRSDWCVGGADELACVTAVA
jgi:hypothetical protein